MTKKNEDAKKELTLEDIKSITQPTSFEVFPTY
jgi:hypothetical protein